VTKSQWSRDTVHTTTNGTNSATECRLDKLNYTVSRNKNLYVKLNTATLATRNYHQIQTRRYTLSNLVVKCWADDWEVTGSSLTHCAVEYGPGQASHAHLPVIKQYSLVLVKGRWCSKAGKATVRLALHRPCVTDSVIHPLVGSKAYERWAYSPYTLEAYLWGHSVEDCKSFRIKKELRRTGIAVAASPWQSLISRSLSPNVHHCSMVSHETTTFWWSEK